MFGGSCRATAEIADCTSRAAPSRSRDRSNCSVTCVEPWADEELMLSRPAIVENCRSSGVATDEAIVSGEAPGRAAETWIVGKSTFGQVRDRQQPVRHHAEDEQARHHERRHDGPADEELGEVHDLPAASAFAADHLDLRARREAQLPVGDDRLPRREPLGDHHAVGGVARDRHGRDSTVSSALTTNA